MTDPVLSTPESGSPAVETPPAAPAPAPIAATPSAPANPSASPETVRETSVRDTLRAELDVPDPPESTGGEPTSTPPPTAQPPAAEGTPPQGAPQDPPQPGQPDPNQPVPGQPTPEAPAEPPWWQQLEGMGFQNVRDEQDARGRLLNAYRQQQQQAQEYNAWKQEALPYVQAGVEAMRQRVQPQQVEPEAGQPQSFWNPPQYDPQQAARYVAVDPETGKQGWKEGTPPEVIAGARAYDEYRADFIENLTTKPHEVFPQAIADSLRQRNEAVLNPLREVVQEIYQEQYQQQMRMQQASQVVQQHQQYLYEPNPYTGQPDPNRPTPYGQAIGRFAEMLPATLPPAERYAAAEDMLLGRLQRLRQQQGQSQQYQSPQHQPPAPPQPTFVPQAAAPQPAPPQAPPPVHPDQQRMDFLRQQAQATAGNRSGALPMPGAPQAAPQGQSVRDLFLAELEAS